MSILFLRYILEIEMGWIVALVFAIAALALLAWRAMLQAAAGRRQRISGDAAIDEAGFVQVGGIPQWISIRSEDRANPVLVLLHGGPGAGFDLVTHAGLRPWARDFTVVQWDQRGAGRTFGRNGARGCGRLSIDVMAEDAVEVIEYALRRTGQAKAVVLGASWGSIVGVAAARRRPDVFHAYVGAGQVVDMGRNEAVAYEALLARVLTRGNAKAVAKLRKIGPPPYAGLGVLLRQRQVMFANAPDSERGFVRRVLGDALTAPGASLKDVWDWVLGQQISIRRLYAELMAYSDRQPPPRLPVPVVIIQGDEDIQTPTSLARDWFETLQAPSKAFVTIPGGGHNAVLAMPDAFHQALLAHVRPLTAQA